MKAVIVRDSDVDEDDEEGDTCGRDSGSGGGVTGGSGQLGVNERAIARKSERE